MIVAGSVAVLGVVVLEGGLEWVWGLKLEVEEEEMSSFQGLENYP